jgi:Tfp pilus assembly protein PilN
MSKLRTIRLDHAAMVWQSQRMALALLVLGAVCTALAMVLLYLVNAKVVAAQTDISRLQQTVMPPAEVRSSAQLDARKRVEITAARTALAELAMPWEVLFKTLEGLKLPGVRLVSIEPDAKQGKVRITARANDTATMLAYVNALEALLMLRNVFLLTHESDPDNGELPVSFNVEAMWEVQ